MSTTGIYGLSGSGIDVDSMVKVGMMTKQNQYDKMYKEEIKNEWMKSAYADLYSEVNTMSVKMLDKKTGDVLKEVPPEDLIKHMIKAKDWLGAFLDKTI